MMTRKAQMFGDEQAAACILSSEDPREAKSLGRQVRGFDEQQWRKYRYAIVVDANVCKFAQHPNLAQFLAATGDKVLVEASPDDRIWGIGMPASDPRATDPAQWRGLNLLGFALMVARSHVLRTGAHHNDQQTRH